MNAGKRSNIARALVALAVGLSIFTAPVAAGRAQAAERGGEATLYGLHALGAGQTARLSVVNRARLSDGEIVPCIRVRLVFDIYETVAGDGSVRTQAAGDGSVRTLRFVRRVEHEATLDPGDAVSFDFTAGRRGEQVSSAVFITSLEDGRAQAVPTLEVQAHGRTILTPPGVSKGFDPQPDPPAAD